MLQLAEQWRDEAGTLRSWGASVSADVLDQCASQLEAFVRERELEVLTIDQAAIETGYSVSAVQKWVASGAVPNAGEKGRPRVRRGDLPRKARRPMQGKDLADEIVSRRHASA